MRMETESQIARALVATLESPNESDVNLEAANVVDGLFAISRSLDRVAKAIRELGISDASTPMGAVELLAREVRDGFAGVENAVRLHREE